MQYRSPSDAQSLAKLHSALEGMAEERNKSLKSRLVFAAIIGASAIALTGATWIVIAWWTAILVTQAISHGITQRHLVILPDVRGTSSATVAFALTTLLSTAVFSSIAQLFAQSGGAQGAMFAALSVCGGMLHVALTCYQIRSVFLAGLAGHGLNMAGLIVQTLMFSDEGAIIGSVVLTLGFLMYLAHMSAAFQQAARSSEALRNARDEALMQTGRVEATARAKSRFLAAVSHELRTPLNGILGSTALMRKHPLSHEVSDLTDTLTSSCDALRRILDDLLDLAKVEAGQINLVVAAFRPSDLLQEIETVWGAAATERGLQLDVSCEGELHGVWVLGDKDRIRQVVVNLVSNAIKYTRAGKVRISLGAERVATNWRLNFDVIDTGPGIPSALMDRLFVPFSQGSDANTFEKGTGLGLSIAREVARLMQGDVILHASSVHGTTFRAHFELAAAAAPVPDIADEEEGLLALPGLRVLVVEDHAVNRTVIGRFLNMFGQEAVFANDGREGVDAADVARFDLILMDLRMPRLSGLEAIEEIRSGTGPNRATPIAILSAEAMSEHRALGLASGADFYLTKPIDPVGLLDVLNTVANPPETRPAEAQPHVTPRRMGYV